MINSAKYINLNAIVFTMRPDKSDFESEFVLADKPDSLKPKLSYSYRLKQILLPAQEDKDFTREIFGAKVKKKFVKKLAKDHQLDHLLSAVELKNAKKFGHLPERYAVHHILPISFGGQNQTANLCVVEEMIHMALHRLVWDKINQEFYWDKNQFPKAYMYVPTDTRVLTDADMPLFFSTEEIKQFKKRFRRWKRTMLAVRKWKKEQKKFAKAKPQKNPESQLMKKHLENKAQIGQTKKRAKKKEENPLLLPPQEAYFKLIKAQKEKRKAQQEKIAAYKKKVQNEQKSTQTRQKKKGFKLLPNRQSKTKAALFVAKHRKKTAER